MSKAKFGRKEAVSPLTIEGIKKGEACRLETKRKIILFIEKGLCERDKIFSGD